MLRIVGGRHRGRAIAAPEGQSTRPTSSRARESLFNILAHARWRPDGTSPLVDARVLDAFAGTGALGIEALSRGAAHATFLDNDAARWLLTPALAAGKFGLKFLNLGSSYAAKTISRLTGTET